VWVPLHPPLCVLHSSVPAPRCVLRERVPVGEDLVVAL
jgi:hypothetical protein